MIKKIVSFRIFINLTFRMLSDIHFQKWSHFHTPCKFFVYIVSSLSSTVTLYHFWKCMLSSIRNVKFTKKRNLTMFITAVCVLSLIKLRWPKGTGNYSSPGEWGGGEAEDLGLKKVRFLLGDPPFECYFTEVIPPNNISWLSRSPPPCLHFASNFECPPPYWTLPKFSAIPPFGFSVTNDSPFCSPALHSWGWRNLLKPGTCDFPGGTHSFSSPPYPAPSPKSFLRKWLL